MALSPLDRAVRVVLAEKAANPALSPDEMAARVKHLISPEGAKDTARFVTPKPWLAQPSKGAKDPWDEVREMAKALENQKEMRQEADAAIAWLTWKADPKSETWPGPQIEVCGARWVTQALARHRKKVERG